MNKNKIDLKSDLVTEENKTRLSVLFALAEIATLILWIYEWPIFALIAHVVATQAALNAYKAEIFYNTDNGNKQYIKKWLDFFFSMSMIASLVLLFMKSPYSALFVGSTAFWPRLEIIRVEQYDKTLNLNNEYYSSNPDILEKHFHIKTLLIPLAIGLLGMMVYGNFFE